MAGRANSERRSRTKEVGTKKPLEIIEYRLSGDRPGQIWAYGIRWVPESDAASLHTQLDEVRAEEEHYKELAQRFGRQRDEGRAEVERLRKALEVYAKGKWGRRS